MPLITRFEEIRAWQEARVLTKQVYALTKSGAISKDYGLRDQIQRAVVSAMTNIAEGFDCDSKTEFARFNRCSTQRSISAISPKTSSIKSLPRPRKPKP